MRAKLGSRLVVPLASVRWLHSTLPLASVRWFRSTLPLASVRWFRSTLPLASVRWLRSTLVLVVGVLAFPAETRADFAQCPNPLPSCSSTVTACCTKSFPSVSPDNPLLITADRCHQPVGTGKQGPPLSGAPRKEFSISSIVRSSTTVTVTTSVAHTIGPGEYVKIASTGLSALDGTYAVKTATQCTPNCTTVQFQYTTGTSGTLSGTTGKVLAHNPGNGWCVDAPGTDATRIGGTASDTGMFRTYGLVYRLMQHAIPIYWLVNPSKSTIALTLNENASSQSYLASDVDAWVLTGDLTDPPTSAVDLTDCTTGCTQPVHRLTSTTLVAKTDSYRKKQFPMRGGAFLIAAENRAAFNDFWLRQNAYATLDATKYAWTTSGIDLYEVDASAKIVYQNFAVGDGTSTVPWTTVTGAPVAVKIDYEPPRIACVGCSSAVAQNWLATAGIQDPATAASCPSGEFVPSDATYCLLNDTDVSQGVLVSGGFSWAWIIGYGDNSPCADSSEKAMFDKLRDYMTTVPAIRNGGHTIFLDASVKVAEGCANKQMMGTQQAVTDGLDLQNSGAEPYILRYPNNLLMQGGDLPPGFASGSIGGWKYYKSGTPTIGYQTSFTTSTTSLRRLATIDATGTGNEACIQHNSSTACDVFTPTASTGDIFDVAAYARLGDKLINGLVFYLPGNQLDNSGNSAELRMLLNSLIALPDETFNTTPTELEVARNSPIVATVDFETAIYQGTYVRLDPVPSIPKATTAAGLSRFTFPYLKGHYRGIPAASYSACTGGSCDTSNASRTQISSLTGTLFDAADHIPNATAAGCATYFNGSCRTIFTTTATGRLPAKVYMNTGNVATLGPIMASNLTTAEQQTLISRILAGTPNGVGGYIPKLGAVDRSTSAVIGPSPLAGTSGRPTIAYFGAADGMLHAICVTTGGGCDERGRELWAYIPRTLLPDLRQSTAHVDGSPHVIDAYGDFDNNAKPRWATVLIFHTGTGRMTANNVVPAVYAIDITTPNNPKVLWEYGVTDVANRSTYEMGVGLNLSAGQVLISNVNKNVAFVQTQNGGTGGAASVLTAINVETGAKIWQVGDLYPTSAGNSARNTAHEAAPASGIPGGAVPIDKTGNGQITDIVYGTLYGDVWMRAPDTGVSRNAGTGPLLRISTDYHPLGVSPAIYSKGGTQYAAFATGGYVDTQSTLWRGTNETTIPTQFAFAVSLSYTGSTIDENNATYVPVKFNFASSAEGGFAQAMVVGGELFVVTDSTNVNSYDFGTSTAPTGSVYRFNFGAASPAQESTLVVASGANSLFNSGTQLFSSSGAHGERVSADAQSTTGTKVDPNAASTTSLLRRLWLRTE